MNYRAATSTDITSHMAKRVKKLVGGGGIVDCQTFNEAMKYQQFTIVVYHPDLRQSVEDLLDTKLLWEEN